MPLQRIFHGLTFRLILMGLLLVALGSAIRYNFASRLLKSGIQEVVVSQQLSLTNYVAEDVDYKIRMRQQLLEKLASELPLSLLLQPEAMQDWLKQRHIFSPLFSLGLMVVPTSGMGAMADYPPLGGRRQIAYQDRDWFRAALDGASFYVGKPGIGRAEQQSVVDMASPIKNADGAVVAVLAGTTALSMPGFLDMIQNNRVGRTGSFLLFSPRDNIFVAATPPEFRLKPLPAPGVNKLHDQAVSGWRGAGITVNANGEENLAAFASVPSANWVLVTRLPTAEAFESVETVLNGVLLSTTIAGLVLITALIFFLSYSLRPLRASAGQMRAMAEGHTPLALLPVVRSDEIGEMVESFNSLVEKLTATERQMSYMAHHDALTDLPNRRSFMLRLKQSAALAKRQSSQLALLFIDLDGFKLVNDQHGHKVGDTVLKRVAERLQEGLRQSDLLGRLGGDEFVLLLNDCDRRDTAAHIATKLIAKISAPMNIGSLVVSVGASIGVALFPQQADDIDHLLALADSAMYEVKRDGRNGYRFAADPLQTHHEAAASQAVS